MAVRAARPRTLGALRDDQACADGDRAGCDQRLAASRTILGDSQRRWLLDGLAGSTARWNLIGQQVLMAQRDLRPGRGTEFNMDGWVYPMHHKSAQQAEQNIAPLG